MKIRDGFKFGLGFVMAGGLMRYLEAVIVDKDPKYTKSWKRIAATLKGEPYEKSCKAKIGFTIE